MISAVPPHDVPSSSGTPEEPTPSSSSGKSSAGRWTVVGMFLFGFTLIGALWFYWDQYTRPFRPLQQAITKMYPTSQAYVVGGKAKSHLNLSPSTLRIVLQLSPNDENPEVDEAQSLNQALTLFHLAEQHQDLTLYEDLEVHLVQQVPERPAHIWTLTLPVAEWRELKPITKKATLPAKADVN